MIDHNVPIPAIDYGKTGRPKKYNIEDMQIGDSIFFAGKAVPGALHRWRKLTGFKFARRRVVENGVEGVRIWRVSEATSDASE